MEISDEQLVAAYHATESTTAMLRLLECTRGGKWHKLIKPRMERLGLPPKVARMGAVPTPLAEILVDGRVHQTHHLKQRLIREGLKTARCEICGIMEWMGKPTPLELDHVNGHRNDNRIENLRILCPNCHAQTDTYKIKNKGNTRK